IWLLRFSLPFLLRQSNEGNQQQQQKAPEYFIIALYLTNAAMLVGTFYLNANLLLGKFLFRRKFSYYFLILIGLYAVYTVVDWLIFETLSPYHFKIRGSLFNIFPFLFVLACSTAYRMIKDKMEADKLAQDRLNENLKTELSLLRS